MSRLFFLPVHLPLIALYVVINFYASNFWFFEINDIVRAAMILPIAALVILLATSFLIRNVHLSALLIFMVLISASGFPETIFLVVVVAVTAMAIFIYLQGKRPQATLFLNAFSIGVVILPIIDVIEAEKNYRKENFGRIAYSDISKSNLNDAVPDNERPSVFHIVVDGYSSSDVVRELYAFDNSEFEDSLRSLGFKIASLPRSSYNQTSLSLASVFAGVYLRKDEPPLTYRNSDILRLALGKVLVVGPVRDALEHLGYRFLFTKTSYSFFSYKKNDVVSTPTFGLYALNPFEYYLIEHTVFRFIHYLVMVLSGHPDYRLDAVNAYVLHALDSDFFRAHKGPYLYFAHILAPHPPFTLDRFGKATDKWQEHFANAADGDFAFKGQVALQRQYVDGYIEKLRFVNKALLSQLRRIISETPDPKVIFVHGDHGSGAFYYPNDINRTCHRERFSPLVAVYASDDKLRRGFAIIENEQFNLSNLYRVFLREQFGADLPINPDNSFFATWDKPGQPQLLTEAQINRRCPKLTTAAER